MAVYTDVSDSEIAAFIADYDLGQVLSCKGIAEGVENSNYLLHLDSGPYILTLYEKRVCEQDLPFFIALMHHLAAKGFHCPLPIMDRKGVALRSLCQKPAALISFLKGLWPKTIHTHHCHALGETIAKMHLLTQDFPMQRQNSMSLQSWQNLIDQCRPQIADISAEMPDLIDQELSFLDQNWPQNLPKGVIHADLFPDNVFFQEERLSGIIDYYFACTDYFAYDLAIALNAWCFDSTDTFDKLKAQALLEAYETIRPLTQQEKECFPLLCRGAALRFLSTRLYDWYHPVENALVSPKDPFEYWQKLLFHQKNNSLATLLP